MESIRQCEDFYDWQKGKDTMKHVVAFDVSKGKSTMTIYDRYKQCEYEGEIKHARSDFQALHERLHKLTGLDGKHLKSYLKRLAFILKVWRSFTWLWVSV